MSEPFSIDVTALLGPGVFLLGLHGRVTYVGKARIILIALAHHALRNRSKNLPRWFPVKAMDFDAIEIIPCDTTRAVSIVRALIDLHNPIHNREPRPVPTTTPPLSTIITIPTPPPQPLRRV